MGNQRMTEAKRRFGYCVWETIRPVNKCPTQSTLVSRCMSAVSSVQAESDFLQIYVFTRAEWLDVIEMLFEGNEIKVSR